jgi:DNA-binding NarL/FixJ family response regulator
LLNQFSKYKREEQIKNLTEAEKEVYELLEEGYSQSKIEIALYKSHSAVKMQIRSILRKLGVKNSKEAIQKVRTKGLLDK